MPSTCDEFILVDFKSRPLDCVCLCNWIFRNGKTFLSLPVFSSWRHKSLPEREWTWNSQCYETAIAEKVKLWVYRHCKYSVEERSSKLFHLRLKPHYFQSTSFSIIIKLFILNRFLCTGWILRIKFEILLK